jgi:RNA polymerase sigma factor (TIGR02999 family)
MGAEQGEVTLLLRQMAKGNPDAADHLFPLIYRELRRLAGNYMSRERKEHTLQPTALVHEAYLKLVDQSHKDWQNRQHFFAVSAQVMRRVLVDHARMRLRSKRGGKHIRVPADEVFLMSEGQSTEVLAVHESLSRLAKLDSRQSRVVELRFFGGLTVAATAKILGVSPKTVKRDWNHAKAWLYGEIEEGRGHGGQKGIHKVAV